MKTGVVDRLREVPALDTGDPLDRALKPVLARLEALERQVEALIAKIDEPNFGLVRLRASIEDRPTHRRLHRARHPGVG